MAAKASSKTTSSKKTSSKKTTSKKTTSKKTNKSSTSKVTTLIQWGALRFRVDSTVVRSIDSFQASLKAKAKDSKCKKQFTDPEEVKFTVLTSLETGGNPIKDYNYLKSFINANSKGKNKASTLKVQEPYVKKVSVKVKNSKGKKVTKKVPTYKSKLTAWKGAKFKLQSVALRDTVMDGRGRIHAARIELSFTEAPGKKGGQWKQVKSYRKKSLVAKSW